MTSLEPLRFRRHCVPKVWGGRALERRFGFSLPPGKIGETWELVDREGENSVVDGGPFDGTTLRALMEARAEEVLGSAAPAAGGRFPLLVKYIDAADDLSVQVHPDEALAAALGGGAEAKTEAWYVVDVGPDGVVYAGCAAGVTADRFEALAATDAVVGALNRHTVEPGDCLLVRGGTVHAIGAGVTILEVQQNSDTTYRLYDWGRLGDDGRPRETHVEAALRCVRVEAECAPVRPAWTAQPDGSEQALLAESHVFRMLGVRLPAGGSRVERATGGAFRIVAVLAGEGRLVGADGTTFSLVPGAVWLVPAVCGRYALESGVAPLTVVETGSAG